MKGALDLPVAMLSRRSPRCRHSSNPQQVWRCGMLAAAHAWASWLEALRCGSSLVRPGCLLNLSCCDHSCCAVPSIGALFSAAGSIGGTMEACFLQPIDTIKTRLQLDSARRYTGERPSHSRL